MVVASILVVVGVFFAWPRKEPEPPMSAASSPGAAVETPGAIPAVASGAGTAVPTSAAPAVAAGKAPSHLGDDSIRNQLGLRPPAGPSLADRIQAYSVEEHRLLASVQRTAGSIPPGVQRVIELRRSGASYDELQRAARAALPGQVLARAAVLEWLDAESGTKPTVGKPLDQPLVKQLEQ